MPCPDIAIICLQLMFFMSTFLVPSKKLLRTFLGGSCHRHLQGINKSYVSIICGATCSVTPSWNLHRSINFCLPPCSIPKLTRRSTFCLPFASERFLTIRAEIPFGHVFFFPMVKLPPKRAQKCAKKVQNERKSTQKSANERKFKKCCESQVANCICADVSSIFC